MTAQAADLAEMLQEQTATGEILKVIAASPTDAQPVMAAIAESACRLCDAYDAIVFLREGESLFPAAHQGPIEVGFEKWPVGRDWVTGRCVADCETVHVDDLAALGDEFPQGHAFSRQVGHRTILATPLIREGRAVGALAVRRTEVRPFSEKQRALLRTFADQAVIAIENVRLFDEVRARSWELAESLEQQTATSGILGVISNSLSDTQPVFDAIVESGLKLFPGAGISVALRDGDQVKGAAIAEPDPARAEAWRGRFPFPLTREYMHGVAILDGRVVDIPDVADAPAELAVGSRNFLAGGYRAATMMPMMRGDQAIGVLGVLRPAPGPLSDRQFAMLRTFASQAVIAIENTRLLHELRESLQQQTATADVLKVISRSTFDIQAVLGTLVGSAATLCQAENAADLPA